jgi:hypothetical protein
MSRLLLTIPDPVFLALLVILFSMLLLIILLNKTDLPQTASALSPQFSKQEIIDPQLDWVDMKTKQPATSLAGRPYFTDILSVDYYSDGKTLNGILWTFFPFQDRPLKYNKVDYGMLIDSDFDKNTGFEGIDYKLEISWDNHTKEWTKKLVQWSINGDQRILNNITKNYSGFSENGKNYILLSLDLGSILYPAKYKAIFYSDVQKDDKSDVISDFTRWVAIPPPELRISTSPSSISLTPGEEKTVEVKVNSTEGYTPVVNLSAKAPSDGSIKFDFKKGFDKLVVPSYGIVTTDMAVSAAQNASIAPYTLTIFANSSFPPEQLIKVKSPDNRTSTSSGYFPASVQESQNVFSSSTMAITVLPPLTWQQQISESWNGFGSAVNGFVGLVTAVIGIAGIIGGWFLRKSKLNKDSAKKD